MNSASWPSSPITPRAPYRASHEPDGRFGYPPQHRLQLKIGADAYHGLKQRVDPIASVEHLLQPQLKLAEQLVKPQSRNHDRAVF